jgi:iron complex outermembrane recepter protein
MDSQTHRRPIYFALAPISVAVIVLFTQTSAQAEDTGVLQTIVVTAQKRDESLREVPISVAVTSGEKLEEADIANLESLTQYTPNFYVAENPIGNYIIVRGIGSQTNQGIEQSVAIFADGIYRGRMQQGRIPLLDLESTQVLRGPQSILFGKNTIGGAVILNSRQPTNEFEASVQGQYQIPNTKHGRPDYRGNELTAMVSGPLSDTIGARMALRDYHADGYLTNVITGKEDPERDEQTGRIVFAFDPNDNFSVSLRYERNTFKSVGRSSQQITDHAFDWEREGANDVDAYLASGDNTLSDFKRNQIANLTPVEREQIDRGESSDTTMDEVSLRLQYSNDVYRLIAISGYSAYDYTEVTDVDFDSTPLISLAMESRVAI